MSDEHIIEFHGVPEQCYYASDDKDFFIYRFCVDKQRFPDVKKCKRGYVSVTGRMAELALLCDYYVRATESKIGRASCRERV